MAWKCTIRKSVIRRYWATNLVAEKRRFIPGRSSRRGPTWRGLKWSQHWDEFNTIRSGLLWNIWADHLSGRLTKILNAKAEVYKGPRGQQNPAAKYPRDGRRGQEAGDEPKAVRNLQYCEVSWGSTAENWVRVGPEKSHESKLNKFDQERRNNWLRWARVHILREKAGERPWHEWPTFGWKKAQKVVQHRTQGKGANHKSIETGSEEIQRARRSHRCKIAYFRLALS